MRAPEKTVKMWNIFMFSRYDKQLFFKSPKITEKGVFETFSYLFIFAVFFWLIFTPLHFSELVLILRFSLILFEHNFPQKRGISNFRVDLSNWLKKLLSWDLSPNNQSDSRVRDSRSFFDKVCFDFENVAQEIFILKSIWWVISKNFFMLLFSGLRSIWFFNWVAWEMWAINIK